MGITIVWWWVVVVDGLLISQVGSFWGGLRLGLIGSVGA